MRGDAIKSFMYLCQSITFLFFYQDTRHTVLYSLYSGVLFVRVISHGMDSFKSAQRGNRAMVHNF